MPMTQKLSQGTGKNNAYECFKYSRETFLLFSSVCVACNSEHSS